MGHQQGRESAELNGEIPVGDRVQGVFRGSVEAQGGGSQRAVNGVGGARQRRGAQRGLVQANPAVPQIDVHTLKHNLSKHGWHVLDTRDQDEWNEGHIAHAHFMPYTAMAPQLSMPSQLDKLTLKPKQKIAVVCASGKRSSTAVSMLLQHGYQRLYNVTGGMEAWQKAGLPMVDADGVACNF